MAKKETTSRFKLTGWKGKLIKLLVTINVLLLALWLLFSYRTSWLSLIKGVTAPHKKEEKKIAKKAITKAPERAKPLIAKKTTRKNTVSSPNRSIPPAPSSANKKSPPPSAGEDVEEYFEIGLLYARKGDYKRAEEFFKKVIKLKPSLAKARNNLGYIYLQQGKYELAEGEFKEAIRMDPKFVHPYYNLACLYSRKGMKTEALVYLKKALIRDERVKIWARRDRDLDGLRSDLVFQALIGSPSP